MDGHELTKKKDIREVKETRRGRQRRRKRREEGGSLGMERKQIRKESVERQVFFKAQETGKE